jgi:hypothetical protein
MKHTILSTQQAACWIEFRAAVTDAMQNSENAALLIELKQHDNEVGFYDYAIAVMPEVEHCGPVGNFGHMWAWQGRYYKDGHDVPGSSAKERVYFDRYFCRECLTVRNTNETVIGNNYRAPLPGTFAA